ncbi:MAG: Rho GTPase activation protein [Piptocephalis tieghemiana]|nr:MAG: Rho GTPase activation protein [Piptocephalis tieghemiana]
MPFVTASPRSPPILPPRSRSGGLVSSLHARLSSAPGIAPAEAHNDIHISDDPKSGRKRRRNRLSGTTEGISSLWKRLVKKASHTTSNRKEPGSSTDPHHPLHLHSPSMLPSSVFGLCLEDAIVLSPAPFPLPGLHHPVLLPQIVVKCLRLLWEKGPAVEGIFRIAPRTARVSELQWDHGQIVPLPIPSFPIEAQSKPLSPSPPSSSSSSAISFPPSVSPHEAASLLRRYLMALPQPLVSPEEYDALHTLWKSISSPSSTNLHAPGSTEEVEEAQKHAWEERKLNYLYILQSLHRPHLELLLSILALLHHLSLASAHTRMDLSNLATVMQPSLLHHPRDTMTPTAYAVSKAIIEEWVAMVPDWLLIMSPEHARSHAALERRWTMHTTTHSISSSSSSHPPRPRRPNGSFVPSVNEEEEEAVAEEEEEAEERDLLDTDHTFFPTSPPPKSSTWTPSLRRRGTDGALPSALGFVPKRWRFPRMLDSGFESEDTASKSTATGPISPISSFTSSLTPSLPAKSQGQGCL